MCFTSDPQGYFHVIVVFSLRNLPQLVLSVYEWTLVAVTIRLLGPLVLIKVSVKTSLALIYYK